MHRFKNILAVCRDESGAADVFAQSVALARANDARLTLIDVVPDKYATPTGVKEREARLSRLLPSASCEGVANVQARVRVGPPFLEIIYEVLREGHDLVVTCPETATGLRSFYPGTTATHLVRKCPCPVWILGSGLQERRGGILACIDPKTSEAGDNALDVKILELARSLARLSASDLHVVHAWEVEGGDRDQLRDNVDEDTRAKVLAKHEGLHRGRVSAMLEHLAGHEIEPQLHLMRSTPHGAIVGLVEKLGIDLVVMGSVNRTGISGFFIGSAAESVLATVRCGLFSVKPDGFRTPVELEPMPASAVAS